MPRTIMTRGTDGTISPEVLEARQKLANLVPQALDAYEYLLADGKDGDKRMAAKDVLVECGVMGREGADGGIPWRVRMSSG